MMLKIRRLIASLLVVCMALPLPSQAGMLGTDSALERVNRDQVMSLLERADVQSRLQAYGVSAADVKARVAALSDDEVAQLARNIERLPAAGSDILGVALIVFLVLLITDILGFTKIFPFTKPIR
jgi:hypothetical protein